MVTQISRCGVDPCIIAFEPRSHDCQPKSGLTKHGTQSGVCGSTKKACWRAEVFENIDCEPLGAASIGQAGSAVYPAAEVLARFDASQSGSLRRWCLQAHRVTWQGRRHLRFSQAAFMISSHNKHRQKGQLLSKFSAPLLQRLRGLVGHSCDTQIACEVPGCRGNASSRLQMPPASSIYQTSV